MSITNIVQKSPDKRAFNFFFNFTTKTYVVGAQKNRLDETVLLGTHIICFEAVLSERQEKKSKLFTK